MLRRWRLAPELYYIPGKLSLLITCSMRKWYIQAVRLAFGVQASAKNSFSLAEKPEKYMTRKVMGARTARPATNTCPFR